jgi:hypothetical protein
VLKYTFFILLFLPVTSVAETLRDPTQPLNSSGIERKANLDLQAIFNRNGQRKVIINGKLLVKGQSISGFTVSQILEQSVRLHSEDGPVLLKLRQKVITE